MNMYVVVLIFVMYAVHVGDVSGEPGVASGPVNTP